MSLSEKLMSITVGLSLIALTGCATFQNPSPKKDKLTFATIDDAARVLGVKKV